MSEDEQNGRWETTPQEMRIELRRLREIAQEARNVTACFSDDAMPLRLELPGIALENRIRSLRALLSALPPSGTD